MVEGGEIGGEVAMVENRARTQGLSVVKQCLGGGGASAECPFGAKRTDRVRE